MFDFEAFSTKLADKNFCLNQLWASHCCWLRRWTFPPENSECTDLSWLNLMQLNGNLMSDKRSTVLGGGKVFRDGIMQIFPTWKFLMNEKQFALSEDWKVVFRLLAEVNWWFWGAKGSRAMLRRRCLRRPVVAQWKVGNQFSPGAIWIPDMTILVP